MTVPLGSLSNLASMAAKTEDLARYSPCFSSFMFT